MKRVLAWSIGGFFVFLLLLCAMLGDSFGTSELQGHYYGTEEWMWPVPDCRIISSYFGLRDAPTAGASTDHKGIDIACQEGTDVVATKSGTVIVATQSDAEGYWIAIQHDEHYMSYYMHNSALLVKVGDQISRGQVIALSGNTGVSSGPHCHFAILKDNVYVDPLDYVNAEEKITYSTTGTTGLRKEMIDYAKQFIGNPYVWGGTDLVHGADCSGFTLKIYERFNISIPRVAADQYQASEKITKADLLPGDLVFYTDSVGHISHVAMYIGNNQIVHASNSAPYPKGGIKTSDINYRTPYAYGRYIKSNYSNQDLKYMAACIAAEALSNSQDGQYSVGYVVINRVNAGTFGSTIKEVVTAKNQFNSPWNEYLNNPPSWALKSARAVLEGTATNPIGTKCFFVSKSYAEQLGIADKGINVGDNIFFDECLW